MIATPLLDSSPLQNAWRSNLCPSLRATTNYCKDAYCIPGEHGSPQGTLGQFCGYSNPTMLDPSEMVLCPAGKGTGALNQRGVKLRHLYSDNSPELAHLLSSVFPPTVLTTMGRLKA
jgi:hypothetical protein